MASDEIGGCCDLNHRMGVMKGERDTWAAACAWQAFRDFLNGTPEQWQARCEQHFIDGQMQIAFAFKTFEQRLETVAVMTAEARAQYEGLTDD